MAHVQTANLASQGKKGNEVDRTEGVAVHSAFLVTQHKRNRVRPQVGAEQGNGPLHQLNSDHSISRRSSLVDRCDSAWGSMDLDEPITALGGDLNLLVLGISGWGYEPEIVDPVGSSAAEDPSDVEGLLNAVQHDC
jgi:hypothetical protein